MPVVSIFEYLYRQTNLVSSGAANFFAGVLTTNPPAYYYIYQFATRLPEHVLIVLLISTVFLLCAIFGKGLKKKIVENEDKVSLVVFFVVFITLLSLSSKKLGIRYALPLIPFLYIAASWTMWKLLDKARKPSRAISLIILTSFVGISFVTSVGSFPNYDYYYNRFIGGARGASKFDMVGLCYGAKESAEYIDTCYPSVSFFAYVGCGKTVAPYYYTKDVVGDWQSEDIVVIEASLKTLSPSHEAVLHFNQLEPVKTIYGNGAKLAEIYVLNNGLVSGCEG